MTYFQLPNGANTLILHMPFPAVIRHCTEIKVPIPEAKEHGCYPTKPKQTKRALKLQESGHSPI